jgi:hypothetical protein
VDTTLTQAVPVVVITAALAFWAWCLWDFQRTPPSQMRTYTESQWWVILVLGSVVGGLIWVRLGRPRTPI